MHSRKQLKLGNPKKDFFQENHRVDHVKLTNIQHVMIFL